MSVISVILCWLAAIPSDLALASPPASTAGVQVRIDPAVVLGPVNRLVLGNNVIGAKAGRDIDLFNNYGGGLWDPRARAMPPDMASLVSATGASVLRWPGGGWPRGFDWHQAVGPVRGRPGHLFGLPEFLSVCSRLNARPFITLPEVGFTAANLADLIEYLNAPNDGSNPNGGTDWARVRAGDGHPKPWGVRWFEFGNESYLKDLTPREYADRYLKVRAALRRVDPNVLLGAVLDDSDNFDTGWTHGVLAGIGSKIDFATIHPYMPKLTRKGAEVISPNMVAEAALSSDADLEYRLEGYRRVIAKLSGRKDILLAVTEFNGLFVQDKPVPYRHTLVDALHNADVLRVLLLRSSDIFMASFWHLVNGYWGMVTGGMGTGQPVKAQANFYVYKLFNRYLGDKLVSLNVSGPHFEFPGGLGVSPREGVPMRGKWQNYSGHIPSRWSTRFWLWGRQQSKGDVLRVDFTSGDDSNYYHGFKVIDVKPDTLYRISVRVRTINMKGGKIGIAVEDERGWDRTFYQPANLSLLGTTPWTWLTVEYRTSDATKRLRILARRIAGNGVVSGTAEFGRVIIKENPVKFGAVPVVVGVASMTNDRRRLYVLLINKDLHHPRTVKIVLPAGYSKAAGQVLVGRSPFSTNLNRSEPPEVAIRKLGVAAGKPGWVKLLLPRASLAGIEFTAMH